MYSLAASAQKPAAPAPAVAARLQAALLRSAGSHAQTRSASVRHRADSHLCGPASVGQGRRSRNVPRVPRVLQRTFSTEDDANTTPVVLDIEHWPMKGDGAQATVSRMLDLLQMVRSQAPRAPIGYYGVPPIRDYWRAIRPRGSSEHSEWQRENDRFKPVAEACDLLFPSLYTFMTTCRDGAPTPLRISRRRVASADRARSTPSSGRSTTALTKCSEIAFCGFVLADRARGNLQSRRRRRALGRLGHGRQASGVGRLRILVERHASLSDEPKSKSHVHLIQTCVLS